MTSSRFQSTLTFVGVAVAYFAAARLGLLLASLNHNASPVWPATGIAILALHLFGRKQVSAVMAAACAANWSTGTPLLAAAGIAVGTGLEALAGATILGILSKKRDRIPFHFEAFATLAASVVPAAVAASIGNGALVAAGIVPWSVVPGSWLTWWVGDCLGALYIVPFAVVTRHVKPFSHWASTGNVVVTAGVAAYLFTQPHGSLAFLLLGALLTQSLRRDAVATQCTALVIAAIGILATSVGRGPFSNGSLNANLMNLQLFLAAFAVTAITLPSMFRLRSRPLPIASLIVGWSIAGVLFHSFTAAELAKDDGKFSDEVDRIHRAIDSRLTSYADALYAGAGLVASSEYVSAEEWRTFTQTNNVNSRYPGALGFGIVFPVRSSDLEAFERTIRDHEHPEFATRSVPGSTGDLSTDREHYIITYLEPKSQNRAAIGLDLASEPARKEVMELARRSGVPTLSSEIVLVQDQTKGPGFLFALPVYWDSISDARPSPEKLRAWIYAPIMARAFFAESTRDLAKEVVFTVRMAGRTVFETPGWNSGKHDAPLARTLRLGQRDFQLEARRSESFASRADSTGAWVAFCAALVVVLACSVIVTLQNAEEEAGRLVQARTRELSDLEKANRMAMAASRSGFYYLDVENSRIRYSEEARNVFGIAFDDDRDADREKIYAALDPAHRDLLTAEIKPFYAGIKDQVDVQYLIRSPRHGPIWVRNFMHAIEKDASGRPLRVVGICQDVTEQKRVNERLEQSEKAKSQFLATMSHEIRTPLNGIMGMTELLSDTKLNVEQREYVDIVRTSSKALFAILNDVLDFSKIEAGKLNLERVPFSLAKLARAQVDLMRTTASQKGLNLRLHLEPGVAPMRLGDPGRIAQLILNLLNNAIKFTERGTITLRIAPGAGSGIRVEVIDTGIGLTEEQRLGLFKPFVQADGSTSRKYGGTGLGLSICKRLCELMNGSIGVESRPGTGSTFWFELPLEVTDVTETEAPSAPVKLAAKAYRVLVAEDNLTNQILIRKLLKALGYHCTVVDDGTKVLAALETESFDIILMDCQMPELDGYETTRRIRALTATCRSIPIVALTANVMAEDERACRAAGMDGYLQKPIEKHRLAEALAEFLAKAPAEGRIAS